MRGHRRWVMLIGAALVVGLGGCVPARMTEVPAVAGRVVGIDGRPVPGATVSVARKPGTSGTPFGPFELVSGADGTFAFDGRSRWILWIMVADPFMETVVVEARAGGGRSAPREITYSSEVVTLGLGKQPRHDVGDLNVPVYATRP